MNDKIRLFIISLMVCLIAAPSVSYAGKFKSKAFEFFEWHNPAPRFADLGFNIDEVAEFIGNKQLLISHRGRSFDLWTHDKDKIESYHNERFVSSLVIINQPRQTVIEHILDFQAYPKHMTQITEGEIVKKNDSNYLVRLRQVYKFVVFSLKTDFWYMYTVEENGNFSALMLDGDVGAGVSRFEFIAIDENRTLLVNTSWQDLDTARFVYRTIIKAQPDLKPTAPIGTIAVQTEQVRRALEDRKCNPPEDSQLTASPDIPIFSKGNIPMQTMKRFSDLGTLVFVHPMQWIQTKKGIKSVEFVSAVGQLPGNIEQTKPISSDASRFTEYFGDAKKVTIRKLNDTEEIDWKFKFALGVMSVGVDMTMSSVWISENASCFKGFKGDMDPLHGAWEWIDLNDDKTLLIFTVASHISDEASWLLKLANRLPNINMLSSLFMGVLIVEKQAQWLEPQIEKSAVPINTIKSNR